MNVENYSLSCFLYFFWKGCCLGIFLFQGTIAWGQDDFYQFNQDVVITAEDGLPTKHIWVMAMGKNGFIWLGAEDGLIRFDGAQFKVYRNVPGDSTSIIDDRVLFILTTENEVWVATAFGIAILDLHTEKFTNYQLGQGGIVDSLSFDRASEISTIFKDKDGNMWIGSRYHGPFKYDRKTKQFIQFEYNGPIDLEIFPDVDGVKYVKSFAQDPQNDSLIWAGSNNGLWEINQYTKAVKLYTYSLEDKLENRQYNIFRRLHFHDNGLIYTGSWGPNLKTFNPATKEYRFVELSEPSEYEDLWEAGASTILRKSKHELWVSNGLGVFVFNTLQNKITFGKRNDLKELKYYRVNLMDKEDRLWWVSKTGLHMVDPFLQQYRSYSYEHLNNVKWGFAFEMLQMQDPNHLMVFPNSSDGLYHLNKKKGTWKKTQFPPSEDLPVIYRADRLLSMDPSGNITLASEFGLFTYNVETAEITPFPFVPDLNHLSIRQIKWDTKGYFWLASGTDGLIRWDPNTQQSKSYKDQLEADGPENVANLYRTLFEDSRGNLWMRRYQGMSAYVRERDTILNFIYDLNPENCFNAHFSFAEDRFGRIWTTSEENWIGYIDVNHPENGVIKKIDLDSFDFPGRIFLARSDLKGDLWITTSASLLHFDVENYKITPHSHDYGQKNAEKYSLFVLSTGELAIGERNYITLANPEKLRLNTDLPKPYVSEIKVLNEDFPLDTSIFYKKDLRLKYNENFFSIAFSAQAFRLGKQTKFRYRLKDFEDWIDAGDRHFANYTNVPSGNYTFQLQAANNEGVWNDAIYELGIHIQTPWWATWWFRTLILMSIIGGVYSIYGYQLFQVKQRERLKTAFNKKLANVEMTALLAQMNPHFLFNCLNSIDSYILKNKSREASEYLNNFARLIRLILQNSRSNYISLKDELEALELYIEMESLRLKDKFQYRINVDRSLDPSMVDIPPMLIQPYVENAIWHGLMNKENKKDGKLSITLSQENGTLRCVVEDNGIGRQKAAALKLNKIKTKSQSMGMTITKDRLELINQLYNLEANVKIIDLVDAENQPAGTQVILEIPI